LGIHDLDQLLYLDMKPGKGSSKKLFSKEIDKAIEAAIDVRTGIRSRPIRDIRDVEAMAAMDEEARAKLELPGLISDALIGDVLTADGKNPNTAALSIEAGNAIAGGADAIVALKRWAKAGLEKDLADGKHVRRPFHWPLEFPEVFVGSNGGFDAMVGNPPFLGGQRISGTFGNCYKELLSHHITLSEPATADLVVYFFLRAYSLIRESGNLGLLARRTFAEGKNREVGLDSLKAQGAVIHGAHTNLTWPGKASVVVHQIHITKRVWRGLIILNDCPVSSISSYLDDLTLGAPAKLYSNTGRMLQGVILNNEKLKISEKTARRLLSLEPKYKDVVFPFIGGNEINTNSDNRPSCWVVNFWDWPESKARTYGEAYKVIDSAMSLAGLGAGERKNNWWRFLRPRPDLHHAIGRGKLFDKHPRNWRGDLFNLDRVIVISRGVSKYPAFTFLPNNFVFSEKLYVVADNRYSTFSILISDIHAVWTWSQKTSMGADLHSLSYTNGDIFETFAFPGDVLESGCKNLENLGENLFNTRQQHMVSVDLGLTGFYNDFHDSGCSDAAIVACRVIQKEINETVLEAYGFDDIDLDIGFHEVGYLPAGKNTRYTMSEGARQEVLSRLALLNKERHEAESKKGGAGKRGASMKASKADTPGDLFAARGGGR
jgi:hypothetical protein